MGDYRYTVAHNSHAIRITGSNLGMVRVRESTPFQTIFFFLRDLLNHIKLLSIFDTASERDAAHVQPNQFLRYFYFEFCSIVTPENCVNKLKMMLLSNY